MHHRLRENLSCCDVDGHLIFLDIAQDRYFKLTGALEQAMRVFQAYEDAPPTLVEGLVTARILIEAPNPKADAAIANIRRPTCSAIEQPITVASRRIDMAIVCEVMTIVWLTRRQLKTRTLKTNLNEASAYRDRKADAHADATFAAAEGKLLQMNGEFAFYL